jgi:cell division inhibitor SulA
MSIPLNEEKIRQIIEELKQTDPNITIEEVIKRIRASRESQGLQWNEDLERKVRYCIQINPN